MHYALSITERIPALLRLLAFRRDTLFRVTDGGEPAVYLTFDDGPIPESTPWILETLSRFGAKATFFMVADNARRYPDLYSAVVKAGHAVGNHTFHHAPPYRQSVSEFVADVDLADKYLHSRLFRPPHGLIRLSQQRAIARKGYRMVMFDLNTLDYRADRTAGQIVEQVCRHVRSGCIVNLHDSLKSIEKLKTALPLILTRLSTSGYTFKSLNPDS